MPNWTTFPSHSIADVKRFTKGHIAVPRANQENVVEACLVDRQDQNATGILPIQNRYPQQFSPWQA